MKPNSDFKHLACLTFVLRQGERGPEVLLIYKKRGIGAGQWNGPGGHVELGETPVLAALREFQEEVVAQADSVSKRGVLDFYIPEEDFTMRVFVFVAQDIIGYPQETDEAVPRWFHYDDIPWGNMWMDDRLWLPHVLKGKSVQGEITMIGHDVTNCNLTWE